MASVAGEHIGVDFIDILFGLVVAEIFVAFTNVQLHEWATPAGLALALVVVVFSWIGYHKAKDEYDRDLSFQDLSLLQFFVDIAIVGIYLALVKQIEHTRDVARTTHVLSIRPEAATLLVIFGLYLIWDLLQVHLSTDGSDPFKAAKSHAWRGFIFLLFFGAYSIVVFAIWKPDTNTTIVIAYVIYFVFCYLYRLMPKFKRRNSPAAASRDLL